MAAPDAKPGLGAGPNQDSSNSNSPPVTRPALSSVQESSATVPRDAQAQAGKRRHNHRAGKKKKNRRQSFLGSTDQDIESGRIDPSATEPSRPVRPTYYRLGQSGGRTFSDDSLPADALLDHR